MGLNEECIETSYVLGRIFAVLESIQKDANPGINATIRDRYFNSACATPASIFPVLIKLKNSHIKKIDRESVARKICVRRKCRNSEAIIIRGAGKVHVRILSSDTKEVRKKGGQVNGRSN